MNSDVDLVTVCVFTGNITRFPLVEALMEAPRIVRWLGVELIVINLFRTADSPR